MKLHIDYLVGTCSNKTISDITEKYGRKSSYKNACKSLKEFVNDYIGKCYLSDVLIHNSKYNKHEPT